MKIPGPAGSLEAHYREGSARPPLLAVLCHPHPQYGGRMDDAVLGVLARVLDDAGASVLRFNFRGVGASEGRFDGGAGETDDLLAAAAWLRARHPDGALWAGGYSFGAWVTWRALGQGLAAARAVLLAPPVGPMEFAALASDLPVDVVSGDADDFIDPAALARWPGIRHHTVDGADHFFSGRCAELAALLAQIAAAP